MRRTILGAVLVLAVATTAHADDKKKAKALYDEGLKHYNLAEYPEAIKSWRSHSKVTTAIRFRISPSLRI